MAIIPAKSLNTIPRAKIVECFCDILMKEIINANAVGKKQIPFVFSERIYGTPSTQEVSEKIGFNWPYCPFESKDYIDEIKLAFRGAGYTIVHREKESFLTIYW